MNRQPIHIDNYEEYFLLYVDNELTVAERAEVDRFVESHPEFAIELQDLLDTRLDIEEVPMINREHLYRLEQPGLINNDNFEEFQVLMLDGELDTEHIQALEAFHNRDEAAKKNFDWLRKTKLTEEEHVFPDKGRLHRTEQKPTSIISIKWYRYAAAAALLITAGLLWINSQNGTDAPGKLAGNQGGRKGNTIGNKKAAGNGESQSQQGVPGNDARATDLASNAEKTKDPASATTRQDLKDTRDTDNINAANKSSNTAVLAGIKGNNGNRSNGFKTESTRDREDNSKPVNNELLASLDNDKTKPVEIIDKPSSENITSPDPMASTASALHVKTNYVSEALNGDSEDEEATDESGKQRKGLRGIVRKANRFYNKVTNPDLDKPIVKVANFEIGLPR